MIPDFDLLRPESVDEAIGALAEGGTPYVGGTELVAAMQIGLFAPPVLVDLKRVSELSGIDVSEDALTIGAATLHDDVAASPLVKDGAPILAQACSALGNQRVRATGSIGGNVCFADHRSDVVVALFALDATVTLRSPRGVRTCPIEEFVLGSMYVEREPDELVVSFEIPLRDRDQVYVRHQPAEYPTLCVAITSSPGGDGAAADVEVVVGAAIERPEKFGFASLDDVDVEGIAQGLDTIEDLNGSEDYKRHLVGVFVRRAVEQMRVAQGRPGGGSPATPRA